MLNRQAAFTEAGAFIRDTSPVTGLLGLPRSGKTRALLAKADLVQGETYVWVSGSGAITPTAGDVRYSAGGLASVALHAYRSMGSPRGRLISALECSDHLFAALEPRYGELTERLMPYFERHLQQGQSALSLGKSIATGLLAGHVDPASIASAFEGVSRQLELDGAITVWGACQAVVDELTAGADYRHLIDGARHIFVDDAQLLWPAEVNLLMALARSGINAHITIGQIQSQAMHLGRVGAKEMVARWKGAGRAMHHLPYARWVGDGHVALYSSMNHRVRSAFEQARDSDEVLDLSVVYHEAIEDAVVAIGGSVAAHLSDGGAIGDVGIFCGDRDWINQLSDHFAPQYPLDIRGVGYGMSSPSVAAAHGVASFLTGHGGLVCGLSWLQLWMDQDQIQMIRERVDLATWRFDSGELTAASQQQPQIELFRRAMESLSEAGPDGLVATLRGAPLWPTGVAPFESALDAWSWWAGQVDLLGDQWDKERWAPWLLVTPPWLPPSSDRLSVIAHDEPFIKRFKVAHVVGFSRGIFPPGGHQRGSVDGNLAQVANAVSGRLNLHHVQFVNLTGIGEVELTPSAHIYGLTGARVVGERPEPSAAPGQKKSAKFTMRPKGR